MTASSVGLFPCRVQPIGLPPAAASNAPFNNSGNLSSSSSSNSNMSIRHPPMRHTRSPPTSAAVRRVSRNLFGKAERSEIDQVMRAEYDRNCAYMRERYNFDIRNPRTESENEEASVEDGPLPILIAKEVELQASKRQRKCNNLAETNEKTYEECTNILKGENTRTLEEEQNASLQTPTSAASTHKSFPDSLQRDNNSESYSNAMEKITMTSTEFKAENLSQHISSTASQTVASPASENNINSQQQQQRQKLTLCNPSNSSERHKTNPKQTLLTGKNWQNLFFQK